MKKTLAAMMILAGGLMAAPRVTVGIGFGAPAPVVRPVCPGPGYTWVDGYNAPSGFVAGYWAPPAAVRVAPHYDHDRDFDRHLDRGHFDHFRR